MKENNNLPLAWTFGLLGLESLLAMILLQIPDIQLFGSKTSDLAGNSFQRRKWP
jgi:hypothetical protein